MKRGRPSTWDEKNNHLLGTMNDGDLARKLNVGIRVVWTQRTCLGIRPKHDSSGRRGKFFPKNDKLLATLSDEQIAARLGCNPLTVHLRRVRLNPELYSPRKISAIKDDPDLGIVPDIWLAEKHQISREAVRQARESLGMIAPRERYLNQFEKDLGAKMSTDKLRELWLDHGPIIKELSEQGSIEPALALAVFQVESSGQFFNDAGLPVARFENHVFYREWGKRNPDLFDAHFRPREGFKNHEFRINEESEWMTFHGRQVLEWQVIMFAASLNSEAAYRSASFGAPQIMGFNYAICRYASAVEMAEAFKASADNQIRAFFQFCRSKGLLRYLAEGNFYQFAIGYNGTGRAPAYSKMIQDAAVFAKAVVKEGEPA